MDKNVCKQCGGKLVIEYVGNYGSVYPLKKDGTVGKRRIRRIHYDESLETPIVYCSSCGSVTEPRS